MISRAVSLQLSVNSNFSIWRILVASAWLFVDEADHGAFSVAVCVEFSVLVSAALRSLRISHGSISGSYSYFMAIRIVSLILTIVRCFMCQF